MSRSTITDTELQIGQFVLPKHGFNVTDDSRDARYLRSQKEDVPEEYVSRRQCSLDIAKVLTCAAVVPYGVLP